MVTTVIELRLMATLANMGFSSHPVKGNSTPAAISQIFVENDAKASIRPAASR